MLRLFCLMLAAALLVNLSGCQTYRPNTALGGILGGTTGAMAGAAIGSHDGKSTEGALIGGIAGGVLGSAIGNQNDRFNQSQDHYSQQQRTDAFESAVTMEQVVQMTNSGLNEDLIINQIKTKGIRQSPSTDDLISLKNSGVSDAVIRQIQNGGSARFVAPRAIPYPQSPVMFEERYPLIDCAQAIVPHHAPIPHRRYIPRRSGFSIEF